MARFLVVADQTAESGELVQHLVSRTHEDRDAEFVLLVPEAPVAHLLIWDEAESVERAWRRAGSAARTLRGHGIRVIDARHGDPSPVLAVEDELRRRPGYDGLIVSTLAPGISRWLRLDIISRLRSRVPLPVSHVVAQRTAARV